MADQALACRLVIRHNLLPVHPGSHDRQNLLIHRPSQIAALCLDDAVGAPGIKSNADLAVPIPSDRELRLVPVAPGLFHTDHWLHGDIRKAADPAQMVLYFLSLESQLRLIGHTLQLTAAAGAGCRAAGFRPVSGWSENLH